MKTILVTGGASLVGKHTLERLVEIEEIKPVTILRPSRHSFPLPRKVGKHYQDLRRVRESEIIFEEYNPETVIHVAARSGVKESIDSPLDYEGDNMGVTLSLLDLARRYGTKRFIFTSTGQVYNPEAQSPFSETTPADKQDSVYAASKRACELFCQTYSTASDMKVTCLRLANIYGPGMRTNMVIPQLVEKALSGAPFTMHGDGTAARDYLNVLDLVDAIILTLGLDSKFEILNIGSGRSTEVRELVDLVQRITGRNIRIQRVEGNPNQDKRLYMNVSKAERVLGWQPKINLEEGIRRYVEWYRSATA